MTIKKYKNIIFGLSLFVTFCVAPQVLFAQSSTVLYGTAADCKTNVQAKGTFQYPSGVEMDSLRVIVDPEFNDKMKMERFTPDLPVTPMYDLAVETVPIFSSCYTDTPEKFGKEPSKTLPFKVSILADSQVIVDSGILTQSTRRDTTGRIIYEWKLKGWPNGIVDSIKIETLINAIHDKKSVKISVDGVKRGSGTIEKEEKETTFGLCAPLWGSGEHKVVYGRGESAGLDVPALVSGRAEKVRTEAFEEIDPFMKYSEPGVDKHPGGYFSHIVDLLNHDDSYYLEGIASSTAPSQYMDRIRSDSSCRLHKGDYAYTTYNYILYANVKTLLGGLEINGIASPKGRNTMVRSNAGVDTVIHEFGHLFADLLDEDGGGGIPDFDSVNASKNCSFAPLSDFMYEGKLYGYKPNVNTKGCNHSGGIINLPADDPLMQAYKAGKEVTTNSDTPHTPVYRPHPLSLMGYLGRPRRFNAVSCGYIIAAIKGGTGPEYFSECAGLSIVKPVVLASAVSPNRLLASVIDVLSTKQQSAQTKPAIRDKVIFERDTPPAMGVNWYDGQPMPVSLKIGLVSSSNTSSSVDLKANTSDGPLSIELGENVTLSWTIPTTATTCTGNWARDTIGINDAGIGATEVTPRFPSTIYTISCKDASGKIIGTASVEIRTEDYEGGAPVQPTIVSSGSGVVRKSVQVTQSGDVDGDGVVDGYDSYLLDLKNRGVIPADPRLPIRSFILNSKGNSLDADVEKLSGNKKPELLESARGMAWRIKYEKKSRSRATCIPPVLNLSFEKDRPLFNGRSTYRNYTELLYQKIRIVPDCEVLKNRKPVPLVPPEAPSVLLREFVVYDTFRPWIPTPDVLGFANFKFVSADNTFDQSKSYPYMMLQRTAEQDDDIPFTEQFNLRLPIIEALASEQYWSVGKEGDRLSYLKFTKDGATKNISFEKETAIRYRILADFVNLYDHFMFWNEDYAQTASGEWTTISYDHDFSFTCNAPGLPAVRSDINKLLPEARKEYLQAYRRIGLEMFGDEKQLYKILLSVDRFPFDVPNEDRIRLKSFIRRSFYLYSLHFNSPELALEAGVEYVVPKNEQELLVGANKANSLGSLSEKCAESQTSSLTLEIDRMNTRLGNTLPPERKTQPNITIVPITPQPEAPPEIIGFERAVQVKEPFIIAPKEGEVFKAGTLMTVRWTSNLLPNDVPIRLSLRKSRSITTLFTSQLVQGVTTPNDGSESWGVPQGLRPGNYFLELSCVGPDTSASRCSTISSGVFRVAEPDIPVSASANIPI